MSPSPVIHWFRRDLRLSDNMALRAACESGAPVLPVFIFDPALLSSDYVGAPRVAFMLKALESLDEDLRERGSGLVIRRGDPRTELPALVESTGATAVYFNRDYSPYARKRDADVAELLKIDAHSFDDEVIMPPLSVMKDNGEPYTVFTPFKKRWLFLTKPEMAERPTVGCFAERGKGSHKLPTLKELGFDETIDVPEASEAEAGKRLKAFISGRGSEYSTRRDDLAAYNPKDDTLPGTSFLSPYLRLGMLSPRQAYWAARDAYAKTRSEDTRKSLETWVGELVWREFYIHILYHFPHVLKRNFRENYEHVAWRKAPDELQAWKDGQTGYPVVDAAMRQLKAMGWMPNRARMIVASFLCKDLLIHWKEGERHFMQCLIDGDPAANNGGWQWTAGTGTDAQPYFRIFNPVSQSEKFDPNGVYIRRWIPELRDVPDKYIHTPWEMDTPPEDYPAPIVDHAFARERTLDAFKVER